MSEQSTGHQWYIARDGKQTGPISDLEIKAIASRGYFREKDLIWRPGFAEWTPALTVFPPQMAPPPPPVPPASTPAAPIETAAPQPQQYAPYQAPAARAPATGRPMPATAPIETPVSQPVTAPPAAAARPAPQPAAAVREPVTARPTHTAGSAIPASAMPGAKPYEPQPLRPLHVATPEPQARLPLNLARETTLRPQPRYDGAAPVQDRPLQRVDSAPEPEHAPLPRSNRMALAAIVITIASIAGGVWIVAQPSIVASLASLPRLAAVTQSLGSLGSSADTQISALDARLQKTAHWPVVKREFPDWYGARLREAAKLKSEQKTDGEIAKMMVDQLVALRRENATQALSASKPRLIALATAFLDNLKQLKAQSTTQCFNFISQGESTPGVIDLLQAADGTPPSLQLQVAAIFEAIGEGRKSPVTHDKPQKGDYDALMDQLGKLGWTQTDVATFADPRALARAEPARVCQMVQDWFVAHISIADEGAQERLLGETLRPVVSG